MQIEKKKRPYARRVNRERAILSASVPLPVAERLKIAASGKGVSVSFYLSQLLQRLVGNE